MSIESPVRLAVLSDIHGNLHALRAVLDSIDQHGIRSIVCCGDVVGYGAFPNECVELLRFRRIPTLAGNHDHAAIGLTDIQFFNEIAKMAVMWTRHRLSMENEQWLRQRPYTMDLGDQFFFSHGSPVNPADWGYVLTFGDARASFDQYPHPFGFLGHSHQPAIVEKKGEELACPEGTTLEVQRGCRYLINVGSVGQPRDHNPQACYVSVDREAGQIEFHRVPYDIGEAQMAIRQGGLPDELAERLGYGW